MDTAKITAFIESLLHGMGVTFDAVEVNEDPATLKKVFIIKTKESGLLIGEKGETFQALSHIVRRFTDKDLQQPTDFSIDVNDYQKSVVDALKVKAVMLANRAADMKIDVEMEPMSSYERLIVHGALNGIPHIKTESVGDKRERRVVIKYVN